MSESTEVTGRQLAAARALAGIGADELAKAAKISVRTLAQIESGAGEHAAPRDVAAVRGVLESAGVEFLAENDGGAGVRLRRPRPKPDSLEGSDLNASNDE